MRSAVTDLSNEVGGLRLIRELDPLPLIELAKRLVSQRTQQRELFLLLAGLRFKQTKGLCIFYFRE